MEHVPGPTRLIARVHLALAREAVDPFLQLRQVIRQLLEPRRRLGQLRQDGDGDRVLVHIHAEVDHRASSRRYRSSE